MRSNKVCVQVNKLIVFFGPIIVPCSIQSMELNCMWQSTIHTTQPTSQNNTVSARLKKALALNAIRSLWVLYKMCVRRLSCVNRLPFSNNGWDLWEPARDQNSLVYRRTVHSYEPKKVLLRPHRGKLNLTQKPEETRSVHVIVGALLGSTSISDQPHDFARYWLRLTNANPYPKKLSNRESNRTINIGYSLNGLKTEPKIRKAILHAICYWHDYPSGIPQDIFVYLCELST